MLTPWRARGLTFWRARRGLAALEFALILPVLVTLLFGLVDLSQAIIFSRRLTVAAQETATIASTMAVQSNNQNALTETQAYDATTAPFALFPGWQSGPNPGTFAITLSVATFAPSPSGCTSGCTYSGKISWSGANPYGQTNLRPCRAVNAAASNTTAPSLTTLPPGVFGPTAVIIADVSAPFVPLFTGYFTGTFTMLQSAYVSPRLNNAVQLTNTYASGPYLCQADS